MPAWFGHRFPSSQGMLLCFLGHNDLHRFCLRLGLPYSFLDFAAHAPRPSRGRMVSMI